MSITADEAVMAIDNAVSRTPRIGLTELTRSNGWRTELEDCGVMEITDRSGTVAFVVTYETLRCVSERMHTLEQELETLECALLYGDRFEDAGRRLESGKGLAEDAKAALREILGDREQRAA